MSEIITTVNDRVLGHIVKYEDSYYYVDSTLTESGFETMIFEFDFMKYKVLNWLGVYCQRYETFEEMNEQHYIICSEIEKFIGSNK